MRNSPLACTPPKNLPVIAGMTRDASPNKERTKVASQVKEVKKELPEADKGNI